MSITYNARIYSPCLAFVDDTAPIVNHCRFLHSLTLLQASSTKRSNSTVSATYIALGAWQILSLLSIAPCPACGSLQADKVSEYPTEQADLSNTTSAVNAKQQLSKQSEQTSPLRISISSSSSYHWTLTQPMLQSRLPWMR